MPRPLFSIITPSYRSSDWLKLCAASVHDQQSSHEHIVQDAGSDDGTLDWAPNDPRIRIFVEKDEGMYDAVNRGIQRASGAFIAYLNCDEQYLDGALEKVHRFFEDRPDVDIVFGDVIVVRSGGEFQCFRKVNLPWFHYTQACANLCTFTAATFIRHTVFYKHHLYFNPSYRALGDAEWMLRALRLPLKMALLRDYTSTFTETGKNLGQLPVAVREQQAMRQSAPPWARLAAPVLKAAHRLRRIVQGSHEQKPFTYSLYTRESPQKRIQIQVPKPTFDWDR